MARGPANQPIPRAVLAGIPWLELLERLTAMAHMRLRHQSLDDAQQLAIESVRVFLDPGSTVVWDHTTEPNPARCLGSILNGLLRNHFRLKRTNSELSAEARTIDRVASEIDPPPTPEKAAIEHDFAEKVLHRVVELSPGDPLVRELTALCRRGILEPNEQMEHMNVSRGALYEARRRFKERLEAARAELEAS